MFLTRVFLNPQRRATRDWLASPQRLHAAVLAGFAEQSSANRPLWRVDREQHRFVLFVVSADRPDLIHLVEQGGWSTHPSEVADYRRFLDQIEVGRQYVFRLRANPVRSTKLGVTPGARGRVVNVGARAQQEEWLLGRAASWGFAVPEDPGDLRSDAGEVLARKNLVLSGRETLRFSKLASGERVNVTLATAQFDGVLEVTDVAALRLALCQGVGRGKAYGCGLMTLAPR